MKLTQNLLHDILGLGTNHNKKKLDMLNSKT